MRVKKHTYENKGEKGGSLVRSRAKRGLNQELVQGVGGQGREALSESRGKFPEAQVNSRGKRQLTFGK